MPSKSLIVPGRKFGRLTIVREVPKTGYSRRFLCRCDCGTEKTAGLKDMKRGDARSCGCLRSEETVSKNRTHGMSKTRVYRIWTDMIKRCTKPYSKGYAGYGAKGIKVCQRWLESFEAFLADIACLPAAGMTLDRINSRGNYEPGNVRWANLTTQARNRRSNRNITINGDTRCLAEWCEIYGMPYHTVKKRLNKGAEPVTALTKNILDNAAHRNRLASPAKGASSR